MAMKGEGVGGGGVKRSAEDAMRDEMTVYHKCDRTWDLNAALGARGNPGFDQTAALRGEASINFTGKLGVTQYRGNSATCRQPNRAISVLATSQYGPEIFESTNICVAHFPLTNDSKLCRHLLMQFVKKNTRELLEIDSGDMHKATKRRDSVYHRLMESQALLKRFSFRNLDEVTLKVLSVSLQNVDDGKSKEKEFGGGLELIFRQVLLMCC
jgi:hypothetical protein